MVKVLVFTPTWARRDGTLAMRPETAASVEALRFDGDWDWEVSLHNPHGPQAMQNVLAQYQRGREMALNGGYDGMLTVEHDMAIPPEALEKLWATPAEVVYGVYLLRHGTAIVNAFRYDGDANIGMSLSRYPDELALARKQGATRVSGAGFGCTLIRRHVLEQVAFRPAGAESWIPDMPFAQDCLRANIMSMARFDVACDHFDGEVRLRADGEHVMDVVSVLANYDVVALVNGSAMSLTAGSRYELPRSAASDLIRAGYVMVLDDKHDEPETAALAPGETAVKRRPARKRKGGL
jgi:hypothetical protein